MKHIEKVYIKYYNYINAINLDQLTSFLASIGINILSSAVYDAVKRTVSKPNPTVNDLRQEIMSSLNINDSNIYADKIIDFLAQTGNITIKGSNIFATNSITMFSSKNNILDFGDGSQSKTKSTGIITGKDAKIVAKGGAGWRQNDDGSISFYA